MTSYIHSVFRKNLIYAYLESREGHEMTGSVRYVGSSCVGSARPLDFLPGHDFGKVGPWLEKCGGTVPWKIVEQLDDDVSRDVLYDVETFWIRHFKFLGEADKNLKVVGIGGNGGACIGQIRSATARLIMSQRQLERYSRLSEVEKTSRSSREAQNRPEVKKKKSEAQKRSWERQEHRQKRAKTDARPEVRKRRSDALKAAWARRKANAT